MFRFVVLRVTQGDWIPEATPALWKVVSLDEYPIWRQPAGAHDAYKVGDRVTHNGGKWVSGANGNVWEPGVYGWEVFPADGGDWRRGVDF